MKEFLFSLYLLASCSVLYGQGVGEIEGVDFQGVIKFTEEVQGYAKVKIVNNTIATELLANYPEGAKIKSVLPVSITEVGGIFIMNLLGQRYVVFWYKDPFNALLVLSNKDITMELSWARNVLPFDEWPTGIAKIWSSGFLTESGIQYGEKNLGNFKLPWVSGAKTGFDYIMVDIKKMKEKFAPILLLSLGFVSAEKPWLFKENSRPKELVIENTANGLKKRAIVKDTYNLQSIDVGEILERDKEKTTLKITIVDVYLGSKYGDVCINTIKYGWLYSR